jgi:ubiquinol-cytochrome c reductase iron-sulfur subunit
MSNECKVDCGRRRLVVATAAVGGVGALAALVPFLSSMLPSERAKAAGAPVEVDIGSLEPGQMMTVEWRGKPVWIINRTRPMLETLPKLNDSVADPKSEKPMQPAYCKNETRSIKPESWSRWASARIWAARPRPSSRRVPKTAWTQTGWAVSCARATAPPSTSPAGSSRTSRLPDNLEVPPHMYLSEKRILIGEDKKGA